MRAIGWFDIYVDDVERARRFYETVLDTELSPMEDPNDPEVRMLAFGDDPDSPGAGGALVALPHASPGPGGTMVYFTCEDAAIELSRVEAAGGSVVRPTFPIGEHGVVALAMDTEGNMIGFHSTS